MCTHDARDKVHEEVNVKDGRHTATTRKFKQTGATPPATAPTPNIDLLCGEQIERHVNACTAKHLLTADDARDSLVRSVNAITNKPLAETGHESFHAIARVPRQSMSDRTKAKAFNALMDPGAELNLIRKSLLASHSVKLKLNIHARQPVDVILMNNGVEIGRVTEAVYLSFRLDELGSTKHEYDEWFYVWENMSEQMILGSAFCKEQSFTNFHLRLAPWKEELSNTRSKRARGVDHVTTADDCDDSEKHPYESGVTQLLECPLEQSEARQRSRVTTTCEKIDQFKQKHSKQEAEATVKQAGSRRASKHLYAPTLSPNSHENHMPVKYDQVQTRNIAHLLARTVIQKQQDLLKQMSQLRESDVTLTSDELETLKDIAKACALEAARWADGKCNLTGEQEQTYAPKPKKRYFMGDDDAGSSEAAASKQAFQKGQCVVLQNLTTHAELNNKPARVV